MIPSRVATTVILLIAMSLSVLWWRSHRQTPRDQVTWRQGGVRYTVRSNAGRVELCRPPQVVLPTTSADWRKALHNNQLVWRVHGYWDPELSLVLTIPAPAYFDAPTSEVFALLDRQPHSVGLAIMLDALEEPDRFAVAHFWLIQKHCAGRFASSSGNSIADPMISVLNGLKAEIRHPRIPAPPNTKDVDQHRLAGFLDKQRLKFEFRGSPDVQIDPDQLPSIRRQWHDLVDQPVFSVPYWALVSTACVPIVLQLASHRHRRARNRARAGLCINCGYDIRGMTKQCPECGSPVPLNSAAVPKTAGEV